MRNYQICLIRVESVHCIFAYKQVANMEAILIYNITNKAPLLTRNK